MAESGEGEELFALEAAVVDEGVDAMGGEPGGPAAQLGQFGGGVGACPRA